MVILTYFIQLYDVHSRIFSVMYLRNFMRYIFFTFFFFLDLHFTIERRKSFGNIQQETFVTALLSPHFVFSLWEFLTSFLRCERVNFS